MRTLAIASLAVLLALAAVTGAATAATSPATTARAWCQTLTTVKQWQQFCVIRTRR